MDLFLEFHHRALVEGGLCGPRAVGTVGLPCGSAISMIDHEDMGELVKPQADVQILPKGLVPVLEPRSHRTDGSPRDPKMTVLALELFSLEILLGSLLDEMLDPRVDTGQHHGIVDRSRVFRQSLAHRKPNRHHTEGHKGEEAISADRGDRYARAVGAGRAGTGRVRGRFLVRAPHLGSPGSVDSGRIVEVGDSGEQPPCQPVGCRGGNGRRWRKGISAIVGKVRTLSEPRPGDVRTTWLSSGRGEDFGTDSSEVLRFMATGTYRLRYRRS